MTRSTIKQRDGAVMVSVIVETQPANIEFAEILEAVEIKSDDNGEAPWENSDGFEHRVIRDETDGEAAGSFCDRRGHRMRVVTDEFENWGSGGSGASKQVRFQRHAKEVKRTLGQLAKWHSDGWYCWGIVCNFKGYHASCWGFYDDDTNSAYMRENIRDIALGVADQMERDGFTVTNKPSSQQIKLSMFRDRIRFNLSLQNA